MSINYIVSIEIGHKKAIYVGLTNNLNTIKDKRSELVELQLEGISNICNV